MQQFQLAGLLSVPAILVQISSIIMEFIDASMVGQLGANQSASIGLVATSLWLIFGICNAAASGFSVQVAHLIGGKKIVKQEMCFGKPSQLFASFHSR